MAYLTLDYLNRRSLFIKKAFENRIIDESTSNATKVFLSHRHKDINEVEKVVGFLETLDVDLYVDYLDHELLERTNEETATILRNKISKSEKFILLATPNSIESIWIPWELGLGDAFKGLENVAILPLTNDENTWEEREYYNLYGTIKTSLQGNWCYFPPDSKNGIRLNQWLINNTLLLG